MSKYTKHSIETPLGKAKGLGSSHHGTDHVLMHHITTLLNIPLVAWIVYSVVSLRDASYGEFLAWLMSPLNIIALVLFIIIALKHFSLELQVLYEDYISNKAFRMIKVIGMKLCFFALGLTSIFAALKVAFSAGI